MAWIGDEGSNITATYRKFDPDGEKYPWRWSQLV